MIGDVNIDGYIRWCLESMVMKLWDIFIFGDGNDDFSHDVVLVSVVVLFINRESRALINDVLMMC